MTMVNPALMMKLHFLLPTGGAAFVTSSVITQTRERIMFAPAPCPAKCGKSFTRGVLDLQRWTKGVLSGAGKKAQCFQLMPFSRQQFNHETDSNDLHLKQRSSYILAFFSPPLLANNFSIAAEVDAHCNAVSGRLKWCIAYICSCSG